MQTVTVLFIFTWKAILSNLYYYFQPIVCISLFLIFIFMFTILFPFLISHLVCVAEYIKLRQ